MAAIPRKRSILRRIVDSTLFSLVIGAAGAGVLYNVDRKVREAEASREYGPPTLSQLEKEKPNDYELLGGILLVGAGMLNAGRASIMKQRGES